MNPVTRLALVAVMAILVAGVAVIGLRPTSNIAAPPTPSSTAAPTPTSTPVAAAQPTDIVLVPETPLPDPPGDPLPGDLIGRKYGVNPPEVQNGKEAVLTLRAADDPHCMAMYGGRSTCFTVLWDPVKPNDPAARGPARIVDGNLVIEMALVPFDEPCVGTSATYAIEDAGATLRSIDTPDCTFPGFRERGATGAAGVPVVFDTRTIEDDFALRLRMTLPSGWKPLHDIVGALELFNTGYPEGPETSWWGLHFLLVEDAQIHDPSDVVSSEPATADRSRFVPWPDDFFAYITALPGVTVASGPEPIIVGGVEGTQIAVMTPPMHPLVWLKDDFLWLGGGKTGVDPAAERRFIVVERDGHTLLVQFADDPSTFDARDAEIRTILDSISFQ